MTEELTQIEITKTLTEESPKVKKRKLLTADHTLWAKCAVCKEAGNLENLVRHGIPVKNELGVELYKAFSNKTQQIKNIVAKIDIEKIMAYPQHPQSKTLRQIIGYRKRILDSNNDKEIFKLAVRTAYSLDTICDDERAGFFKQENYLLTSLEEIIKGALSGGCGDPYIALYIEDKNLEKEKLEKILKEKPRQFKKKWQEIKLKTEILSKPKPTWEGVGWNSSNYREPKNRSLAALAFTHEIVLGKVDVPLLDLDPNKKDKDGNYKIKSERTPGNCLVPIPYWLIGLMKGGKIYHQDTGEKIGDLLGVGDLVALPVGRKLVEKHGVAGVFNKKLLDGKIEEKVEEFLNGVYLSLNETAIQKPRNRKTPMIREYSAKNPVEKKEINSSTSTKKTPLEALISGMQKTSNNCKLEGRQVSTNPATYQIIDTAGSSEQRQGLTELKEVIEEEKQGQITNPLTNRPALYGTLLNGNKINFFARKSLPSEIKDKPNLPLGKKIPFKAEFTTIQEKVVFRCDTFLIDKIKNTLTSQHLAGNYEYPNLSYFFRSALHAYQHGMPLTYQRELNNPRKEVSFRMTEELMTFYNSLPLQSKADILERALGSYYYQ
ncbi:39503_t:CDS:10 [Gigaspora margarita]|uniref:39503_t:CDS:1 n=1 Tax=Gigaspora margarita TaxID=4874 RepID=A0ABM8VWD9_GIGMA|nr:39503_t:CDS:10 [Gigaspora margarita]